jgi:hypothetical protein
MLDIWYYRYIPVKKRLGPIKWLRTINALKNIRPTQKVRNMPNSSRTCMSKLFVRTFFRGTTLARKRSPCWIWTENHTVRFDPEFRFAIEISYIEFALPFHNRYQDWIIFYSYEILITSLMPKTHLQSRKLLSPRLVHILIQIQRSST